MGQIFHREHRPLGARGHGQWEARDVVQPSKRPAQGGSCWDRCLWVVSPCPWGHRGVAHHSLLFLGGTGLSVQFHSILGPGARSQGDAVTALRARTRSWDPQAGPLSCQALPSRAPGFLHAQQTRPRPGSVLLVRGMQEKAGRRRRGGEPGLGREQHCSMLPPGGGLGSPRGPGRRC